MRLNIRTFFLVLSTLVIVCILTFWSNCSNQTFDTFSKHVETNYEVSYICLICRYLFITMYKDYPMLGFDELKFL